MDTIIKTIGFDGTDEIIYSKSFNIYANELIIPDLLGFKIKFIFETTDPQNDQKDVVVTPGTEKELTITFSKKFRNSLGSITTEKLAILKTENDKQVLFSIFGQQISNDILHITVNFYLR